MKNLLLKVVASVSLLLGLLGPQVATGQMSFEPQSSDSEQMVTVVTANTSGQTVTVATPVVAPCGQMTVSVERMDLFIWQACGSLTVKDSFPLPALAVVVEPEFVPEVVVQSQNIDWFSSDKLTQSESSDQDMVFPPSLGSLNPRSILVVQTVPLMKVTTPVSYITDHQNTFTKISMRC